MSTRNKTDILCVMTCKIRPERNKSALEGYKMKSQLELRRFEDIAEMKTKFQAGLDGIKERNSQRCF